MTTALFVIDIQNDLATDPTTRIPDSERITTAGRQILSAARGVANPSTGTPELIIFVQHEEKPEDGPLVRGSTPWGLVFEPQPGERLVAKQTRGSRLPPDRDASNLVSGMRLTPSQGTRSNPTLDLPRSSRTSGSAASSRLGSRASVVSSQPATAPSPLASTSPCSRGHTRRTTTRPAGRLRCKLSGRWRSDSRKKGSRWWRGSVPLVRGSSAKTNVLHRSGANLSKND